MEWFKTYIDKTLIDEKLEEMTLEEWGIRFLIQCYLGRSKIINYVYLVKPDTPTTDDQFAKKMRISLQKWQALKKSMLAKGVIDLDTKGAVGIPKWAEHQSDYYRQRPYRLKNREKTGGLQEELQPQLPTTENDRVTSRVTGGVTHRIKNQESRIKNTEERTMGTSPIGGSGKPETENENNTDAIVCRNYYYERFEAIKGVKYNCSIKKDTTIFSNLTRLYPSHWVKGFIDFYLQWKDDFVIKAGYTTGILLLKINSLLELGIHKSHWVKKHEKLSGLKDMKDIIREINKK